MLPRTGFGSCRHASTAAYSSGSTVKTTRSAFTWPSSYTSRLSVASAVAHRLARVGGGANVATLHMRRDDAAYLNINAAQRPDDTITHHRPSYRICSTIAAHCRSCGCRLPTHVGEGVLAGT